MFHVFGVVHFIEERHGVAGFILLFLCFEGEFGFKYPFSASGVDMC